jgi:hypothetical protein
MRGKDEFQVALIQLCCSEASEEVTASHWESWSLALERALG